MGSLLSVAAGSAEEAKLIVMNYQGANSSSRPYVLVGKGITFDTGVSASSHRQQWTK